MANRGLFHGSAALAVPTADVVNEAGGVAYAMTSRHALAQYAVTGCLNGTFYADAEDQLKKVLELVKDVDSEFIGKVAVYSRQRGNMKDMPALLCVALASRMVPAKGREESAKAAAVLKAVFPQVIDNGKMLRNFVQILRSSPLGRKAMGTALKRLIATWFATRKADVIFKQSVGQKPTMGDVVALAHPKPVNAEHEALFGYFVGSKKVKVENLPPLVKAYEAWKVDTTQPTPDVPFEMLSAHQLTKAQWTEAALRGGWQMVRMNLATFARHGVFEDKKVVKAIAEKLRDPEQVKRARVMPYQLLIAYLNTERGAGVPTEITLALQDAMEIAVANVPKIDGDVIVCPDASGSMESPATGHRKGATSAVTCRHVAALVAASVLRANPQARVIPFTDKVHSVRLNPRDSIMTNTQVLAKVPAGGTACSAPLALLNEEKAHVDVVIFVSDNQSWVDVPGDGFYGQGGTKTMVEWAKIKKRCPKAKMACIDVQPYPHVQAKDHEDIINIGGFSDAVFDVISTFVESRNADHWVEVIEKM